MLVVGVAVVDVPSKMSIASEASGNVARTSSIVKVADSPGSSRWMSPPGHRSLMASIFARHASRFLLHTSIVPL